MARAKRMKNMHNPTLPLVLRNSSSRKSDDVAITLCGLALTPKTKIAENRVDHLVVYRNPHFGRAARQKSKANLKQSWLPVISTPMMEGIYLEDEAKSTSAPITVASGKIQRKSPGLLHSARHATAVRLAQLRYSLLILGFIGASALLTGFMLDVVSGQQNREISATANLVDQAQAQPVR